MKTIIAITFAASLCIRAYASTYYIDFDHGNDANNGTSVSNSLKHCPGDPAAEGTPAGIKLSPGDTVIFKGGVAYRGMVKVDQSGTEGRPIVFDGNTAGTFGTGKAIIEGAEMLTGWKRCASAAEAKGNPNWSKIFYLDVPRPKEWNSLNLCDADTVLPIAQWPKPKDPFFQADTASFALADEPLKLNIPVSITAGPHTNPDGKRPLYYMIIKKAPMSAVMVPLINASFSIQFSNQVTAAAVGIAITPKHPAVKEVAFFGDDKELIKVTLEKDKKEIQKFNLPAPAKFTKLTVKLLEAFEGELKPGSGGYAAVGPVAVYGADGVNLLDFSADTMTLTDPNNLTQKDPHYYDGMLFGFHGGNNLVFYKPVQSYDPVTHRLTIVLEKASFDKHTYYSLFNSVKLIDQPGEHSVEFDADPKAKTARVFLLPPKIESDQPVNIVTSKRDCGITMSNVNYIIVQGLLLRRQNGNPLSSQEGSHIIFRDCEVTMARGGNVTSGDGSGVYAEKIDTLLIERCYIHHNPGWTRGIALRSSSNVMVRDCRIVKNTGTGIGCLRITDGKFIGNLITDHRGQHANGLTVYVESKNILVENNRVMRGHNALTFHGVENIVFRNNIFDSNLQDMVIGVWGPSPMIKNVQFLNNCIIRGVPKSNLQVGLFCNNKSIDELVFKNNIIDGYGGNAFKTGVLSNNLFTRAAPKEGWPGENELTETDLRKIFVDPDNDDFHLKPGSPAIGAGVDVGLEKDIDGHPRPKGKAPDIGAYDFTNRNDNSTTIHK